MIILIYHQHDHHKKVEDAAYAPITALRLLNLRKEQPDTWRRLARYHQDVDDDDSDAAADDGDGYDHDFNDARLEHHNMERREEEQELWEHHQVNVVQFLTQVIDCYYNVITM